jgi:hypothetical protein
VSSQGAVKVHSRGESREQQILFRPTLHGHGTVQPHIFVELCTGEGEKELYFKPSVTQQPGNQRIRVHGIGRSASAVSQLDAFLRKYLHAEPTSAVEGMTGFDAAVKTYDCEVFLSRGLIETNLSSWTTRLRDFMVDRLGWKFIVCNVCNLGLFGACRDQQLVFRYEGERREIPPVKEANILFDKALFMGVTFPTYWQNPQVLSLKQAVAIASCDHDEIAAMQHIFDHTFKRVLTRDRSYDPLADSEEMPYRLEVVHAFRSENANLHRNFSERRLEYTGPTHLQPKTLDAGAHLNSRLGVGEALLYHGTNPSSAMGILKNGFVLNHAGKSTGTMFGSGMYLAECSSKSDEYARDDNGGTYPGLMALLVCRCLVGNPSVVQEPGDYTSKAKEQGFDCVVGDRESKVGTYREFIFFDERQVIPEYAVIYRRQYDASKVEPAMRQATKGTTGRNWQVQVGKAWVNMTPDVTQELNEAVADGQDSHERSIGPATYKFDVRSLQQTNLHTSCVKKIRPPMRR